MSWDFDDSATLDRIAKALEMLHDVALEALLDHHAMPTKAEAEAEADNLGSAVPPGSESALRGNSFRTWAQHRQWLSKQILDQAATMAAFIDEIRIAEDLARSPVPPGSDSAAKQRDQAFESLSYVNGELARLNGELDAANRHVKILMADRSAGFAASLRSCAQIIMENEMERPEAIAYLSKYADTIAGQPAVPPGSDSALRGTCDEPPLTSRDDDSESALPGRWRVGSKVKLNVYDGDRPVCQCHSFLDAMAIAAAMNRYINKEPPSGPPTPTDREDAQ
jgi:hypothetical protein